LKKKWITISQILVLFLIFYPISSRAAEKQEVYRVSAYSPIRQGDVAGAQNNALNAAKEKAIEKALTKIVPRKTFQVLLPLLEARVVPQSDTFIANYKITNQDVSDLAYTVHLSVTVDLDLLRKHLTSLGVIKGPGSHALAVIYVTLDVPVGLKKAKNLGVVSSEILSESLEKSGVTVIPMHSEDEFGFRFIRPPQDGKKLLPRGRGVMADLAVGIVFQLDKDSDWDGDHSSTPLKVSVQWIDLVTETVTNVHFSKVTVDLESEDPTSSNKGLNRALAMLSNNLASDVRASFGSLEIKRKEHHIYINGSVSTPVYREFVYRLTSRLGEGSTLTPSRFTEDGIGMVIWSTKSSEEIGTLLDDLGLTESTLRWKRGTNGFNLDFSDETDEARGVRELGEEIYYYKRLPVPGVENPEDLKKIEIVLWQEDEENGTFPKANIAPVNAGILGKIDPSRDHDLFRFEIPRGAVELSVLVEQTGPNEIQPRVRMFDSSGKLFKDAKAKTRGRNAYFSFPVDPLMKEIVLSVEDNLNRYASMFPYVLTVGVRIAEEEEDEPT